jgi:hypothetical protein
MALGGAFATLLSALCLLNMVRQPIAAKLAERNSQDYGATEFDEGAVRSVS